MVEYYDNIRKLGAPIFPIRIHDTISAANQSLELKESINPSVNLTLIPTQ